MRKIDIHTHIFPEHLPKFKEKYGYGGFGALDHHRPCHARMIRDDGTFLREIDQNCWDPLTRIKECDQSGVEMQVLSTPPLMFSYWAKGEDALDLSKFLNDHLASVVSAHPTRFKGLANLPMQSPKLAIKELERCIKELGLSGAQIGTHINQWNLDDENLFPFFEAAQELGAALFVHPWDMMGQDRMPKYWLPWLVAMPAESSLAICSLIFGGVFERLPKLRIAFAHGGGSFGATFGRIEQGYKARPDLCAVDNPNPPRKYLGRFFVDSITHDENMLKHLISLFGANSIALGTDYPFPLGETEPGKLIESISELSPQVRDQLLYMNALEWLGIEETK